jgi:hypothetical protein
LIDNELSAAEAQLLERHIEHCADCQQAHLDFLNLRSQIVTLSTGIDSYASRQALADVLAKIQDKNPAPARSGIRPPLFTGFGLKPAFAAIALLVLSGVIGVVIYRNLATHSSKPSDDLVSIQKPNGSSSRGPEVQASPTPSAANSDSEKPNESKKPKPRSRQPVELPKPRQAPNDLISPWSNQAIAANTPTAEFSPNTADADRQSVDSEALTVRHLGQSELLLRSFRNLRTDGSRPIPEVDYERRSAQRLVYQNIRLRREADANGDVQVSALLESLEPILLDIANLPDRVPDDDLQVIKERLKRKNLVALLQVNSTVLARAYD